MGNLKTIDSDTIFWLVFLLATYPFSVVALIRLWKKQDGLVKKIFWSFIVLIPFFGPFAYAGLYQPPSVQPKNERAAEFDTKRHGTGGV